MYWKLVTRPLNSVIALNTPTQSSLPPGPNDGTYAGRKYGFPNDAYVWSLITDVSAEESILNLTFFPSIGRFTSHAASVSAYCNGPKKKIVIFMIFLQHAAK